MSKKSVTNAHYAKCPGCGDEYTSGSWELGDDGDRECGKCGCEYRYYREIVSYFTCIQKGPDDEKRD